MTEEKKTLETQPLQDSEYFKIPTGFAHLADRISEGGFRRGELVVISSGTRRPNPCLGTLTKTLVDTGFFKGIKQIDQEVDGELYQPIEKLNDESHLTIRHGKLRQPSAEERNQALVGHGQVHLHRDVDGKAHLTRGPTSQKIQPSEDPFDGVLIPKGDDRDET